MAYTITWDEASPVGATTPAADIDEEFQNLKIALRERLEQVIPDFGNDGVDPKAIAISVVMCAGAGLAFTVNGSQVPALTEQLNTGGYTTGASDITIDVTGKYLVFIRGNLYISNPTGLESIYLQVEGTATVNVTPVVLNNYHTTASANDVLSGFGWVDANAGEKVNLRVLVQNVVNQVNITDTRLLLVRVA